MRFFLLALVFLLVIPSATPALAATTFASSVDYSSGDGSTGIDSADLDGDSDVDLVVANFIANTISILFNNGNGTYASPVAYSSGVGPFAVRTGDLDGDTDLDIVSANFSGDNVTVFINQGSGTFASGVNYTSGNGTLALFLINLDGDSDLDIAAANNLAPANMAILLNNGNGTFAAAVTYSAGSTPSSVVAVDLDGDLDADLAVANQTTDLVSILLNNGSAVFAAPTTIAAGDFPRSITAANFDGDGDIDLAVANQSSDNISILFNNGNATFAAAVNYAAGDFPFFIAAGDFDNDSDQDLVVANSLSGNIGVYENNGAGTLGAASTYTAGVATRAVTTADLDGDGDRDIATANLTSDNVSVLLNNLIVSATPSPSQRSIPPLIDVRKVPSPLALPDGPGSVTYIYTIANPGTITMTNISLIDNACFDVMYISGDINGNASLETYEVWTYRCTTILSKTTVNFARARGVANDIESVDTAIVEVFVGESVAPPLIHLMKTPQPPNLPFGGGSVLYTYLITNPGTAPLNDIALTDDVCSPVTYISGDLNNNAWLEPSETWRYQCMTTLTKTTVNTAVATGDANGRTAIDPAIAMVVVDDSQMPEMIAPYSVAEALANSPTINADKGLMISAGVQAPCKSGALIKLPDDGDMATQSDTAVYYCGEDGKRYVFPNEATYFTWYSDFSQVLTMKPADLEAILIGGNVTYRPGSRLLKVPTDSKFYAVAKGGVLRWVIGEETARMLYGSDWGTLVNDIPEAFFVNYVVGPPITLSEVR